MYNLVIIKKNLDPLKFFFLLITFQNGNKTDNKITTEYNSRLLSKCSSSKFLPLIISNGRTKSNYQV